jgi:surface antigen
LFNKEALINYLEEEKNFRMQGSTKDESAKSANRSEAPDKEDNDDDDDKEEQSIIDNNNYVGRNCLSFIMSSNNGKIRYKFYNKFFQSMESPGVRNYVGNH